MIPQARRSPRRLPHLFQGRLDQRAAGHHRHRPHPRAHDVQGHPDRSASRISPRTPRSTSRSTPSWTRSTGRNTGRPTAATRPRSPQWQKEFDDLAKAEKAYIIKDELDNLYAKNGGTGVNASTGGENTGYYVTMPSNKVELQMLDRVRPAHERLLPRVLLREGRHHGGAPPEREPARLLLQRAGQRRLLRRVALPLGRDRLDGRHAEDHQGRPHRVPQQVLRPQQRGRHLRRRLRSAALLAMAEKYFGRDPPGAGYRAHPDV